jgi:hypothetical protein
MKVLVRQGCRALGLVVALAAATAAAPVVFASSDPFVEALPVGGTGVGFVWKSEHSVYRGDQGGLDNLPLYLYEGERAYLSWIRVAAPLMVQAAEPLKLQRPDNRSAA